MLISKRTRDALGSEASATVQRSQDTLVRAEQQINSFLGDQFLPAHPLFVLVVLQQLEALSPLSTPTASAGYLYEALILRSLHESITDEADVDTNKNYLSEFAYYMYDRQAVRVPYADAHIWHQGYCSLYRLSFDFHRQRQALLDAALLDENEGQLSFKYPYLYYYFLANYFATNLSRPEIREQVQRLTTFLHQADAANVILFLCHLSRDPFILGAIMDTAASLFASYEESDLEKDVEFLNAVTKDIETRSIEAGDPEKRRQELLAAADEKAHAKDNGSEERTLLVAQHDEACDIAKLNDQLQLNAALKTIQIIGQILRNHVGSLQGETKKALVSRCYSLGLRGMKCLFGVMQENIEELVEALVEALARRSGVTARQKLVESVNRSLWGTLELGAYSLIKYVSDSIGMEKLAQTFNEVLEERKTLPMEIIDLSIKLDHYRGFPEGQVTRLAKDMRKNLFAFALVRDLVWLRFYVYHADYKLKQRVCDKIGITQKGQRRLLDSRVKQKGKQGGFRPH